MQQREICIVGLGLLGGSYAMGLTRAGIKVTAIDTSADAIAYGLKTGIIAQGATQQFEPLLQSAQAVVLGLYPNVLPQWLNENQHSLQPGTFITDVCGVKTAIVAQVQHFLRNDLEFIASHPMAGKEVSGVEHADCAMFSAANFIITPTEKNTKDGIAFAQTLAQTLGFAHITQLSCAQHDQVIGYVSQLTHAIAVSLMNANDDPKLVEYTGDSFRDLTRIAKINENLWSELFLMNREVLCDEIEQFEQSLDTLKQTLKTGDEETLKALFRNATQRRKLFDQ